MELKIETINDILLVKIGVDVLDSSNEKDFKCQITPILRENKKILFDMHHIKFMDSSGCGAILSCLRQMNSQEGDLKVFGLQKTVWTLFKLIRMHRIIEIFDNQDDALRSFS